MNIRSIAGAAVVAASFAVGVTWLPLPVALGNSNVSEIRRLDPKKLPRFDYLSQVTMVDPEVPLAHIAGQTPTTPTSQVVGSTLVEQLPVGLKNFDLALEAAGSSRNDVVQMNVFYVDPDGTKGKLVTKAVADYFAPERPPAVTYVGVERLISPSWFVEIEGVALAGGEKAR